MKLLAVVCVLLLAICDGKKGSRQLRLDSVWKTYKQTHNKIYSSNVEEEYRRYLWEENVAFIQKHNLEYDLALHTYNVGINQYSDWSLKEFAKYLLGTRPSNSSTGAVFHKDSNTKLPDTVDWREKGYVTLVKNQGQCGSCWAFSATGSLEGQHFRKTGQLVSLSEQNLIDCSWSYGNEGCNGGLMSKAFMYVRDNGGTATEECYPYEAKDDSCRFDSSCIGATCQGYRDIQEGSESSLQDAVANQGPISVAIDSRHLSFKQYKSGVFYESLCSSTLASHAVLVVGYGTEDGNDYWLVKNSWGSNWGAQGYIKMSRNQNNNCAIATYATYPIV